MATIRIFLAFICFASIGSSVMPDRDLLSAPADVAALVVSPPAGVRRSQLLPLLPIALGELGVREWSGKNDGPKVETYLAAAGLKKGQPWCAAFVSWVYQQAGYLKPRTGWSPALFPASQLVKQRKPGVVFGIYYQELKRIGHCGFVLSESNDWLLTLEGNTNGGGSREGDGVYRKRRHVKAVHAYADWRAKPHD